ncbi:MAG: hypothetical protein LBD05_02655 [Mycoplasmataceae bacterium]|nr:hypothetical protein [Mycoplasmataceae bacterium]
MGSGKTTIASGLLNKSKINKFKIIDIDSLIVKETKMSINDIFAKYGEKYFRDLETRTLEKISKEDNLIVSCGGGIILRDENLKIMKESGYVIYINRTIKNIISTINTSTRPLLKDGVKKIREIFKKRKQRYFSSADYIIENNKSVNDAITQLLNFSKLPIVGFQGINGSYSNIAANKYFNKKENKFICFPTFEELLDNYEKKIIDYVVIPIFNSTTGEIKQTTDLISKLKYKKELTKITIPIHHNLLALQTSKNIKNIWSHPQALKQCSKFIKENKYVPMEKLNTAIACKELIDVNDNNVGVIASTLAAKIYNLKIIAKNIEDKKNNKTTFLILKNNF